MMGELFSKIVEMSVMGSIVILITMLARFLLRKRSKRFIMILWAVVAMRLLVPINIESSLSIFNYLPLKTNTVSTNAQVQEADLPDRFSYPQAVTAENVAVPVVQDDYRAEMSGITESPEGNLASTGSLPDIKTVLAIVWLAGTMAITGYCSVRYILLKRNLKGAKNIGNNVFVSDKITTPFVFGFFVPGIYLPEILAKNEKEYVLLHERTHIRHGDQISKIVGIFIVAVHWFNPLVWLAYALFEQDIEMSCDECVVADMDADVKKAYAMSIVSYAKMSNNKRYLVTPLGFSKVNFSKTEVTNRVKNIINYKKGKALTAAAITVVLLFVALACGLNSKTNADEVDSVNGISLATTETAETEATETSAESKETEVLQSAEDPNDKTSTSEMSEPEATGERVDETTALSEETSEEITALSEETSAETTAASEDTSAGNTEASEPAGTPEEDNSSGPDSNSDPAQAADEFDDFAAYVKSFTGTPYIFAGDSVNGVDASGFVMYCYMTYYGISLPHGSNLIWENSGKEVSMDDLQVGDIICYNYGDYCGHVAIYIGDGNVIHASSSSQQVCCSPIDMMEIMGIKRII